MNSIEYKEQRAKHIADARQIVDIAEQRGEDLNTEERSHFDKHMDEASKLAEVIAQVERKEMLVSVEQELKTTKRSVAPQQVNVRHENKDNGKALRNWFTRGIVNPSMEDIHNAALCGIDLNSNQIKLQLSQRSMLKGTNSAGGYMAPSNLPDKMIEFLNHEMQIRLASNFIQTADGRTLPFVQSDDTGNSCALTTEANANSGMAFADATLAIVNVGAYKFTSGVKVSTELLQDSIFDVESYLAKILAQRVAARVNPLVAVGTGSSQPQGLTYAASANSQAAAVDLATAAVTYDSLYTTKYTVPRQYRTNGCWVMHDATVKTLLTVKDSTGAYLYQPNVRAADGLDTMLGDPVIVNNSMPLQSTTDAKFIVYGSLKDYYVFREVGGIEITRLDQTYRESGLIGFLVDYRFDARWIGPQTAIQFIQA